MLQSHNIIIVTQKTLLWVAPTVFPQFWSWEALQTHYWSSSSESYHQRENFNLNKSYKSIKHTDTHNSQPSTCTCINWIVVHTHSSTHLLTSVESLSSRKRKSLTTLSHQHDSTLTPVPSGLFRSWNTSSRCCTADQIFLIATTTRPTASCKSCKQRVLANVC